MSSASLSHLVFASSSDIPLIARIDEVESAEALRAEEQVASVYLALSLLRVQ